MRIRLARSPLPPPLPQPRAGIRLRASVHARHCAAAAERFSVERGTVCCRARNLLHGSLLLSSTEPRCSRARNFCDCFRTLLSNTGPLRSHAELVASWNRWLVSFQRGTLICVEHGTSCAELSSASSTELPASSTELPASGTELSSSSTGLSASDTGLASFQRGTLCVEHGTFCVGHRAVFVEHGTFCVRHGAVFVEHGTLSGRGVVCVEHRSFCVGHGRCLR